MNDVFTNFKRLVVVKFFLGIAFFATGLILNLVQCVLYFTLKYYFKQLYRRINYYLCYAFNSVVVFLMEWWASTECIYYFSENVDKYFGKEHALCIQNHSYEIDFMTCWLFADRFGVLGNCKAYAKKEILYIPTLGWSQKFSESIFLERNMQKDKIIIDRQIDELLEYQDPIALLLFPEATRFNSYKHQVSLEYAKEHNLPILKHHLNPRTKGFLASMPALKRNNVAIFDLTLAFPPEEISQTTVMNVLCGRTLHPQLVVERIPIQSIPDDECGQEKFLRDLFVKKDRMLDSFYNTGDFFATSGVQRLPGRKIKKRYYSLINAIAWIIFVHYHILSNLVKFFYGGEFVYFAISCTALVALYVVCKIYVLDTTKQSRASSFGSTSPTKVKKEN